MYFVIFPFFYHQFHRVDVCGVEKLFFFFLLGQTCASDTFYVHLPDICSISMLDLRNDMQFSLPILFVITKSNQ